jgi:hypothetical protein
VSLVDRHQVCSATKGSGFFVSRTRYRDVNLAQNEGHALAVHTGHRRQWCTCPPRGGREAFGGVPTPAFPKGETLDKARPYQAGDPLGGSRFRVKYLGRLTPQTSLRGSAPQCGIGGTGARGHWG